MSIWSIPPPCGNLAIRVKPTISAQAVFTILARKAGSLGRGVIVAGWLYQATRLTAANSDRAPKCGAPAANRRPICNRLSMNREPNDWTQIAPLLEAAMGALNQKERDAIVLRYFQGKSLQEVGRAFGGSENAAKKRVHRGLGKIAELFCETQYRIDNRHHRRGGFGQCRSGGPGRPWRSTVTAVAVQGAAASSSTLTLIKGALKIMAWTKLKTTVVVRRAVLLLAAGTTTITVKEIEHHREDSVWTNITRLDSRQLTAAPPVVRIRPALPKNPLNGGWVTARQGKRMGFGASVASLLSDAYEINKDRIANNATLPAAKYDYIVSLPENQLAALQSEIKDKLGLVGRRETRDTEALLLEVASPNAVGLQPASSEGEGGGGGSNSSSGHYTSKHQPITSLAGFLEGRLDVPVIDKTGLTGRYDIDLTWYEPGGYRNPNKDGLKQAVLDNLGLKLTPSTQPIEMLVVENAK